MRRIRSDKLISTEKWTIYQYACIILSDASQSHPISRTPGIPNINFLSMDTDASRALSGISPIVLTTEGLRQFQRNYTAQLLRQHQS